MNKCEIIERLKNIARHAVQTSGEEPFVMSLDDGIAVSQAIELLKNQESKHELKPCPFCGGEAEICSVLENKSLGKYWYVRCKTCYSRGSGIYESGKELEPNQEYEAIRGAWERAIEAWNRRVGEQ